VTEPTEDYESLAGRLAGRGIDVRALEQTLARLVVETPSWGYEHSGTRFATFPQPGRPRDQELRIEYKLFEPAFYATDIADWGSALLLCQRLGPQARVLVDLGHHAQGINVEQIVALLGHEGRLGGFHFSDRRYADDDLIVGSVNPFELFLIFCQLVSADGVLPRLTIHQSHNVEPKLEAMVMSVVNLQEAYAKALLVDRAGVAEAQAAGDVLAGHELLLDAYNTDVRPLCAPVRVAAGAAADPVAEFRASGYAEQAAVARSGEAALSARGTR
jgi:L-rhamnose isomerase/sugar isomerase